jgi:hypothetical protein
MLPKKTLALRNGCSTLVISMIVEFLQFSISLLTLLLRKQRALFFSSVATKT